MSDSTDVRFSDIEDFYEHLAHIGTPRHSGRYPWGSGENAYQRHKGFLQYYDDLKKSGMTESQIAKAMGIKSPELRAKKTAAVTGKRMEEIDQVRRMHDKGMSNVAIGKQLGLGESTVRGYLKPSLEARASRLQETVDFLKSRVDEDGYIDVGAGVEHYLAVSNTKKQVAIAMLKEEGYQVFYHKVPTHGDKETNIMVLARPDKTYNDLKENPSQIKTIAAHYDPDSGEYRATMPPVNFSSKRIGIRYAEDGGADMDGVIQLRRGVEDLSLNGKAYAQVRIAVDGTHYLKGMAMYGDDSNFPPGKDIIFNTNKTKDVPKDKVMKPLQRDDENPDYVDEKMPFGSMVTQKTYIDKNGKQKLSPLNRVGTGDSVNEEGRWNQWSKTFSSQFLSKQSSQLAQEQLDLTFKTKRDDLDDILKLTNPAVKKKLLEEYADGADSSAVHLKAAGLPRTRSQVILPINSLKDGEVYAPNFRHGETVVLVRHPHGGTFEIPQLRVNNKNKEALAVLKQAEDAVGINANVAKRLSGADFDGDSVLVIPNNSRKIKTDSPLEGLKNFDPQSDYPMPKGPNGEKISNGMTPKGKQKEMGVISNLITDMTIKKANHAEIARAVRHSMVVIDAEKHNLDYKRSAKDNNIAELKKKYQFDPETGKSGASTVISRARSQERPLDRKPRSAKDGGPIDPKTGEKVWEYTGKKKLVKDPNTGEWKESNELLRGKKSTKMAETNDAHTLSSGTPMETVYANHANRLKALANEARKEALVIKPVHVDPVAKRTYANEVNSLLAKLNTAQKNAPLERQARLAAKAAQDAKKKANPHADASQLKKAYAMGLEEARIRVGAKKETVTFTDREWEAVQANAISTNVLNALLANAKADHIKQLATPRERPVMTDSKIARAKAMLASGYTQAEIADAIGVPGSTLSDALA